MPEITIIKCFFCKAEIAVVHKDLKTRSMHSLKLNVLDGYAIHACTECGAVQILDRQRR